tara:strand:- start:2058 stop:2339 length:282 start_codon:yes stop_codon:yes gene_type:complete
MIISRMNKVENMGKLMAFFDIQTEDDFVIKGFKIVNGSAGLFVGFPSNKNKDGEFFDTIFADKTLKQKVNQLALEHYNQGDSSKEKDTDDLPF